MFDKLCTSGVSRIASGRILSDMRGIERTLANNSVDVSQESSLDGLGMGFRCHESDHGGGCVR